jgi:hypothetical protein
MIWVWNTQQFSVRSLSHLTIQTGFREGHRVLFSRSFLGKVSEGKRSGVAKDGIYATSETQNFRDIALAMSQTLTISGVG